jgi:hypothetical protein
VENPKRTSRKSGRRAHQRQRREKRLRVRSEQETPLGEKSIAGYGGHRGEKEVGLLLILIVGQPSIACHG